MRPVLHLGCAADPAGAHCLHALMLRAASAGTGRAPGWCRAGARSHAAERRAPLAHPPRAPQARRASPRASSTATAPTCCTRSSRRCPTRSPSEAPARWCGARAGGRQRGRRLHAVLPRALFCRATKESHGSDATPPPPRQLMIVPQFHANSWGIAFAGGGPRGAAQGCGGHQMCAPEYGSARARAPAPSRPRLDTALHAPRADARPCRPPAPRRSAHGRRAPGAAGAAPGRRERVPYDRCGAGLAYALSR